MKLRVFLTYSVKPCSLHLRNHPPVLRLINGRFYNPRMLRLKYYRLNSEVLQVKYISTIVPVSINSFAEILPEFSVKLNQQKKKLATSGHAFYSVFTKYQGNKGLSKRNDEEKVGLTSQTNSSCKSKIPEKKSPVNEIRIAGRHSYWLVSPASIPSSSDAFCFKGYAF